MVNWKSKKTGDFLLLANGLVMLVLINLLSSQYFFRIDLTEEKRYSIHPSTRALLKDLDDDVFVEVFLEGELNAGFRRFQKSIRETLDMFRVYSDNKVHYTFSDPGAAMSAQARQEFMAELASKGIRPTNVIDTRDGERIEKIVFPGAVISYGGVEQGVMLLKGNNAAFLNRSVEGVEFEMANTIYKLTASDPPQIGLVKGHGELDGAALRGFTDAVTETYHLREVTLDDPALDRYRVLVIAKPTTPYSPADKVHLDQYIMRGGRVLFLVDRLDASMDSTTQANYFAFPYETGLDDQLFRYGVRVNPDLVQDRYAAPYPVVTSESQDGRPQIDFIEWPFFPLINRYASHVITRNLDRTYTRFVSSIDTVKAQGITKTPLLFTSQYSRKMAAPVNVNINELRRDLTAERFTDSFVAVAYLLEGKFTSLYKNRFLPEGVAEDGFIEDGLNTSLIVVGDGDLARNEVNPRTGEPLPLGFDPFTNYTYANRDLLLNMISFLADENGLIRARSKEVRVRPLDREQIAGQRWKWQAINLVLPLALLFLFGMVRFYWRKRKYANFS